MFTFNNRKCTCAWVISNKKKMLKKSLRCYSLYFYHWGFDFRILQQLCAVFFFDSNVPFLLSVSSVCTMIFHQIAIAYNIFFVSRKNKRFFLLLPICACRLFPSNSFFFRRQHSLLFAVTSDVCLCVRIHFNRFSVMFFLCWLPRYISTLFFVYAWDCVLQVLRNKWIQRTHIFFSAMYASPMPHQRTNEKLFRKIHFHKHNEEMNEV